MGIKSFFGRIFIVIICFLFLLFVLEMGMRLSGWVLSSHQRQINLSLAGGKDGYRILCLGESTTARGGVDSWPEQLEEVLKEEGIDTKVINGGVEGITSDAIVAKLGFELDLYRPNIVITMVGVNDWVGTVQYENNPQTKIVLFLKDLRVFKLGRTIYLNLSQLFSKHSFMVGSSAEAKTYISESSDAPSVAIERHVRLGNMYCDQHKYWLSEQLLERAMQIDPQDGFACHCLVVCYKNQGRYEDALGVLKDYIRLSNNNEGVCVDLGDIYMTLNRYSEAETMYKKALEFDPKYEPAYTGLGLCYTLEGRSQENYGLAQKIASERIENDRMYGFVAAVYNLHGEHDKALEYSRKAEEFRSRYYNPATRHNYQLIKDMVSQKGAKLICMQYPLRSIDSLKKMFDSVDGVIFVENKRPFIDAIKLGKHEDYFTDNFGGDFGHCTRKGNRLIAENVADTINKNNRR